MVTLSIVPYTEIEGLSSLGRIRKLLNIAKEDKIVLLQGRLRKEEEAELIKVTMEEINSEFKGIELAVINPLETKGEAGISKIRNDMISMLLGDRHGLTVVGPASIVKSIRKDPHKIELLTKDSRQHHKKRKR
ncbi:DUF2073 domain-containing protein [Candidatus Woesearchaeota archaeon]|nr:DUF2073 domain-containing protein [Candidatus Woesearchaeota archaeon]